MRFEQPLTPGRLVRRYKRFLADVALDSGESVTAHCANPGSMLGLAEPGMRVWLSPSTNPARKLAYSWELVAAGGGLVGINTAHPNAIAAEAIAAGAVPELAGYGILKREVRYGKSSRIDILLSGPEDGGPDCYVEVKNVHLMRSQGLAEFPDSVTARGAKHLAELSDMVEAGHRAVMLYLVQRGDCERFSLAGDIDPAYERALGEAAARGVETLAYACNVSPEAIELSRRLPVVLPDRTRARSGT
ncbi:MAG: DNA/RNA nuclease SfsA [Rhodovibrionaceae bacterium]|nr:DNA/RNA nuclease SfsA [Rhodovibrionaceae bacterium]